MCLIDTDPENSEKYLNPLISALKYLGVITTLNKLLENPTDNDWKLLLKLKSILNNLHLFNLADELTEKSSSFSIIDNRYSIIFSLESNLLYPTDIEKLLVTFQYQLGIKDLILN